ncbi:Transcription factor bHLH155 [Zea mays]|uniref:Transcription factor bHLH155 n=1 Tax=Zea mays TaxID=4577 RepID=A0A3L6DNP0_MAIZE|nr:Transcription factor bHLH155 [Zea mays]
MLLPVLIASQMDRATNPPVVASAGRPCADRMLMWEDGFCRPRVAECLEDMDGEDPVRKAFIKMSIQLYNYGEGLMGKVASDKCHKWVFKEPSECEPNISNYWQSSFDALPPEWTDQFASGIQARAGALVLSAEFSLVFLINTICCCVQTIAVIQAGHGLLQLGSCKIIPEDLHFVLRMRHMFESLGYQSGFFLSQLFSSSRGASPTPTPPFPLKQPPAAPAARAPPQLFSWPGHHQPQQLPSPLFPPGPGAFHPSSARPMPPFPGGGGGGGKDEGHMFHLPPAAHHGTNKQPPQHMDEHHHQQQQQPMVGAGGDAPDGDLRWPNGLSFFTALTGRADDAKLLFGGPGPGAGGAADDDDKAAPDAHGGAENVEEYLSLESHSNKARKVDSPAAQSTNKFKRSFTLPARMSSSSSTSAFPSVSASTAPPQQQQAGMEYRGPHEGGVYSDLMETFLE